MTKATAIYVIQEASTCEYIKFGSKCAWATSGAAKNAWHLHTSYRRAGQRVLFAEQDEYDIVELLGTYQYMKDGVNAAHELIDGLLEKNIELERQVASLEDRLRAALVYPMDKR